MKINCLNIAKNLSILLIISLILAVLVLTPSYALTSENINFQGKIVRNDTGYEGLNVVAGSPTCVVDGAGNDTCDFQVSYYTAATGGTLLLTETFTNVEIGQYQGVFELSLGTGSLTTSSQCRDGTCNTVTEVLSEYNDVYIELKFAPDGTNLTETFTRMPLEASPFSIFSKYSEGARDAFRLSTSLSSTSQSSPTTGMIYFNTGDSQFKGYNGSSWIPLQSLWTDAGAFTYLTSTTDNLVLGASTVSDGTFFFDMSGSSGEYFAVDNGDNTSRLFTILANGNVGIGTDNPTSKFQVAGANSTISNSSGDLTISTGGLNGDILLLPHGTGMVGVGTDTPSKLLHIGKSGTLGGTLGIAGSTSGLVTIQTAAVAGTWTLTLPTGDGDNGQVLTTDGNGVTSWTTVATGSPAWNEITAPTGNLSLAHGGYTTSFTFNSVTTGTAFGLSSSSLTSGNILGISSSSTGLTGSLADITLSGSHASNTGSLLSLNNTGTLNTNTTLLINHYATGTGNLAFRVNDESGDTTPFVIDGEGNVGVGVATPEKLLHVDGESKFENHLYLNDAALTGATPRIKFSGNNVTPVDIYASNGGLEITNHTNVANSLTARYFDAGSQRGSASAPLYTAIGNLGGAGRGGMYFVNSSLEYHVAFSTDAVERMRITTTGQIGFGETAPTAILHLKAGTASANTAPLKFTAGTNLTTAESGAMEWDGSRLYITNTTPTRNTIAYTSDLSSFITGVRWNEITAPAGNLSLAHGGYTTSFTFNSVTTGTAFGLSSSSLTSGNILGISSSSTGLTGSLADITLSGSHASNTGSLLSLNNTGTLNTNTTLLINHYATGTGNLAFRVNDESGDTTPFVIDGEGNVGVGISNPSVRLEIARPTLASDDPAFAIRNWLRFRQVTSSGPRPVVEVYTGSAWSSSMEIGVGRLDLFTDLRIKEENEGLIWGSNRAGFIFKMATSGETLTLKADVTNYNPTWARTIYSINSNSSTPANRLFTLNVPMKIQEVADQSPDLFNIVNTSSSSLFYVGNNGNVGIGNSAPTAALHLKAGTASANTAPLKFTAGTNLTTAESGAMEWDGSRLYITNTTPTRNTIAYLSDLTSFVTEDNYVDSLSFGTSDGVLTLGRTGSLADLTVNLDGRYALSSAGLPTGTEGQMLYNNNGTWTAFSGVFWDDVNNRLAVGNTAPAYTVDVTGNIRATGSYFAQTGSVIKGSAYNMTYIGINQSSVHRANFVYFGANSTDQSAAINTGGGNPAGLGPLTPQYSFSNDNDTGMFGGVTADTLGFSTGGAERMRIDSVGNVGIGVTSPTAYLHLKAGTASANTAPLKFTAGTNLTTAESGAMEWDGSRLYITNTTPTRNTIAYTSDLSSFITGVRWNEITAPAGNLSLAHGGYTTSFTFNSVTTGTAFGLSSSSLTSGNILGISSSSTGLTGSLADITLSGSHASNTGSLLSLNNTGTLNTNTTLLINHYATGTGNLAFRVNDESGDTTPFVIDGGGRVGIGTSSPSAVLNVVDNNSYTYNTNSFVITQPNSDTTFQTDVFKIRSDSTIKISDRYNDLLADVGVHINYHYNPIPMYIGKSYSNLANTGLAVSSNATGTHDFAGSIYSGITTGVYNANNNVRTGLSVVSRYSTNNYTAATNAKTYGIYSISSTTSEVVTAGATKRWFGGYFSAQPSFSSDNTNSIAIGIEASATGAQYNYAALFPSGNVGIGTTTPLGLLDVRKDSSEAIITIGPASSGDLASGTSLGRIRWWNTDSSYDGPNEVVAINAYTGDDPNNQEGQGGCLTFATNVGFGEGEGSGPIERMRITAHGLVGIGTTTPVRTLDVFGNMRIKSVGDSGFATDIYTQSTLASDYGGSQILFKASGASSGAYPGFGLIIDTGDNTATNRGARFGVRVGGTEMGYFAADTTDVFIDKPNPGGSIRFRTGASYHTRMTLTDAGYLGLGLVPSYQLELSTNSAAKPTSNTWTVTSDSRLKNNIQSFTDGLNVIEAINPVTYVLNGKAGMPAGEKGIGVIAQEIKDVAPYTVGTFLAYENPSDTVKKEFYNFDSSALTFVLINAIKEQQNMIRGINTKISNIEQESNLISPSVVNLTSSGWYRISQLNGSDDYAKLKIQNTTFGSSQNLILSINLVNGKGSVNVISNFTTGGYDISKARVNTVNNIKYLEIYLGSVNSNTLKVNIENGNTTNWITTNIVKVADTVVVENEYEFKGLLFAVSDTLEVEKDSVRVIGNLLTQSNILNNIGDEVNRWNDIYAKGAIRLGSGVGQEGAIRFNVQKQVLEFSNDGTTWLQLGDLSSQSVISPEYPGAILFADGSDNFGNMTSDAEESTGTFKNYYEWVSDRETLQDYDILVRITLPNDFVSWKDDAIYLDFMTENSASVNNNKVDMYLMGKNGIDAQVNNGISKLPGAWERISIKSLDISDCRNAGDTCTLRISMSSLQSYFVRVGDITLNYNRGL